MPTRRQFIGIATGTALAAVAGCIDDVSPGAGGTESDAPTDVPTTTAPDTSGPDTSDPGSTDPGTTDDGPSGTGPTSDERFDPVEFPEGPKSEPSRPETLSDESVRTFVRDYEFRRVYNRLWMGEGTDVELDCEVHSVDGGDEAYEVLVSCTGYANTGGGTDADGGTRTEVHADWFTQWFVYLVTPDALQRRRADESEQQ